MDTQNFAIQRWMSRCVPAMAVAGIVGGAVVAASAGAIERSPIAVDGCDTPDGSAECVIQHLEYIACKLEGNTVCLVPCCALTKPEEPKDPNRG